MTSSISLHNAARIAAWLLLTAIVVLSLVPPAARPATMVPHKLEHAGIFILDGAAFAIAYLGAEWLLGFAAVAFSAGIELAQLMVPGRHARVSDFVVDAFAACIGVIAGTLAMRMKRRRA
jgi:VanZ family protein